MSTTFDVFPSVSKIPTFDEVLHLSNLYLKNALEKNGITHHFQINVQMRKNKPDVPTPTLKSSPAVWNDDEYAWFFIAELGGSDAYYRKFEEPDDICDGMFSPGWAGPYEQKKEKIRSMRDDIEKCKSIGYRWNFRRSMGQSAIVNLAYGMVAAAFAKLTNGIIFSDDGAWDFSLFPVRADEFLQHYFDPQWQGASCGDWAERCLEDIRYRRFDE